MSDKNLLDDLMNLGVDVEKRRIYFGILDSDDGSYVDWATVEAAIRGMHRMYEKGTSPIEIHMSSMGGDPYEMLRLVDEIECAPVQVKFVGGGIIASAATWIMAVCDLRTIHKGTSILVHDGSEYLEDRHTDFQIAARHSSSLQSKLYDLFARNSRMPRSFWEDVCQRDLYLTAEEAVLLGIADKVISPRKRGSVRKIRNSNLNQKIDNKLIQKSVKEMYERINKNNIPKIVLNEIQKEEDDDSISE